QSGARTFLSAATSNGSKALERFDPVEYSGAAADKNVRAPVASQEASRFAQTFAYSNPARLCVKGGRLLFPPRRKRSQFPAPARLGQRALPSIRRLRAFNRSLLHPRH